MTFAKITTALITVALVVGAVWMFVAAYYSVAAITGVLAAFFGFFVVRDVRKALKEQDT